MIKYDGIEFDQVSDLIEYKKAFESGLSLESPPVTLETVPVRPQVSKRKPATRRDYLLPDPEYRPDPTEKVTEFYYVVVDLNPDEPVSPKTLSELLGYSKSQVDYYLSRVNRWGRMYYLAPNEWVLGHNPNERITSKLASVLDSMPISRPIDLDKLSDKVGIGTNLVVNNMTAATDWGVVTRTGRGVYILQANAVVTIAER